MTHRRLIHLVLAASVLGLAACSKDSTAPASLIDETQLTADVASTAGDAVATDVANLLGNEAFAALPAPGVGFDLFGATGNTFTINRTRTCYDASNAVVANCAPATTVKVVTHVTVDGSRTGTNLSAVVHRVRDLTVTRNFTAASPPVEVSRTHDGVGSSNDTTTFSNTTTNVTRTHDESSVDSTIAVTFNLPHATNPWPVSGKMVRRVAIHVVVTTPTKTETRDVTRRVEVDYPADAQGNVTLLIDTKSCTLNLVTHAVTGCH